MHFRGITDTFGVEAQGVRLPELSGAQFAELYQQWKAHGVMLVRGQDAMTDAQFEAFSRRFGELDPPPNQGVGRKNVPGFPDLYVVSNEVDRSGDPLGALGYSEAVWHTDMSYLPVPPIASMLWAIKLPASGGNLRKGVVDDPDPKTAKGHPHPAVIRDPGTGKPALFLGRRPRAYVMGLELAESEALLDELWQHAVQPANVYEHRWQVGDVLIWSNYSAMHRRDEFDK